MSHWPWTKSRDVIVQVCSGCPLTMGLHPLYSSMVHRLFVQCRVGHRSELCKVAAEYRFLTVTVHGPRSVRWAQFRNGMSNDNLSFGRPIRPICRHEYSVCRLSRRWTPIKWLNKSRWNRTWRLALPTSHHITCGPHLPTGRGRRVGVGMAHSKPWGWPAVAYCSKTSLQIWFKHGTDLHADNLQKHAWPDDIISHAICNIWVGYPTVSWALIHLARLLPTTESQVSNLHSMRRVFHFKVLQSQ